MCTTVKHIKMKKALSITLLAVLFLGLSSCSNDSNKWEYKTVEVSGRSDYQNPDFNPLTFDYPKEDLDTLGANGWELVNVYSETETVFPNYGDDQYVTGIKANTRTSKVVYVFKRKH